MHDRCNAQFEVFSGLDCSLHCITFLFNFGADTVNYFAGGSAASFWKAGSERNGSKSGSNRDHAGVIGYRYEIVNRCVKMEIARSFWPKPAAILARMHSYPGPSQASFDAGFKLIARSTYFIASWPSPSPAYTLARSALANAAELLAAETEASSGCSFSVCSSSSRACA